MLIICDLDGTLIDSAPRHLAVLNDLLAEYGLPAADGSYLEEKRGGLSTRDYLRLHGIGTPEARQKICTGWIQRIEEEQYLKLDTWIQPRCRKIAELHDAGHRIVLLSARRNAAFIIAAARARFPFLKEEDIRIVDPMEVKARKRAAVAALSGGEPGILIGDTEADAAACEGSAVLPWLLNTGFRSEAFLAGLGCQSHDSLDGVESLLRRAAEYDPKSADPRRDPAGKEIPS